MAFTYEPDASTDRDKVRLLLGDTTEKGHAFSDAEITFMLSEFGGVYTAALAGVDLLIAKYARLADSKSVGPLTLSYASRVKNLQSMKAAIQALALKKGAPIPYAGGISLSDKEIDEEDTDLWHYFETGMQDNPGGADDRDNTRLRDRDRGWG